MGAIPWDQQFTRWLENEAARVFDEGALKVKTEMLRQEKGRDETCTATNQISRVDKANRLRNVADPSNPGSFGGK